MHMYHMYTCTVISRVRRPSIASALNQLFNLKFCICVDHDHSSIEAKVISQGQQLELGFATCKDGIAVGLTSILHQGQLCSSVHVHCIMLLLLSLFVYAYVFFVTTLLNNDNKHTRVCGNV